MVTSEVRHQVRRIGNHPSIALWAGNNENEGELAGNNFGTSKNETLYFNDYVTLYVDTIQTELYRNIPNSIYVTSSPSNGLETIKEGYVSHNPNDIYNGDGK